MMQFSNLTRTSSDTMARIVVNISKLDRNYPPLGHQSMSPVIKVPGELGLQDISTDLCV